jgi:hypothetical protein
VWEAEVKVRHHGLVLLFALAPRAAWPEANDRPPALQIPAYPGTTSDSRADVGSDFGDPEARILRIYRTNDGRALDPEAVVDFFRRTLEPRGWKDDVWARKGTENYLGLRFDVARQEGDGGFTRVAQSLAIWIAPKDGMYTLAIRRWAISRPSQEDLNRTAAIRRVIEEVAGERGYKVQQAWGGRWQEPLESEHLAQRTLLGVSHPDRVTGSCVDGRGHISIDLLTYTSATAAEAERRRLGCPSPPPPVLDGAGRVVGAWVMLPCHRHALRRGGVVLLIDDHERGLQKAVVDELAEAIEAVPSPDADGRRP